MVSLEEWHRSSSNNLIATPAAPVPEAAPKVEEPKAAEPVPTPAVEPKVEEPKKEEAAAPAPAPTPAAA